MRYPLNLLNEMLHPPPPNQICDSSPPMGCTLALTTYTIILCPGGAPASTAPLGYACVVYAVSVRWTDRPALCVRCYAASVHGNILVPVACM